MRYSFSGKRGIKKKMYLLYTSQTAFLGADAGDIGSDSNLLIETILILEAAKQSTARSWKAEIAERLEAKNANRVVKSPNWSSDFIANIQATSENATRLALYQLWLACREHVNSNRLGSFSQNVTGLEQVHLSSLERINFDKCNFSNMTRIVNRNTSRRIPQWLERVHTDIWSPYQVFSIREYKYFWFLNNDLTTKFWLFCIKSWKELYPRIKTWQTVIGLQTENEFAIYHYDNARKYQKFESLVQANRVWIKYTTAYLLDCWFGSSSGLQSLVS